MPPTFRIATEKDVPAIIALMGDDEISRAREGHQATVTPNALVAFSEIDADPNNELWVGEFEGAVIATLQLTVIPGLRRDGLKRAQVESVRVHSDHRSQGVGEKLLESAMDRARSKGCAMMQLTTDTRRAAAQRFYVRLGFEPTHVGMKRKL